MEYLINKINLNRKKFDILCGLLNNQIEKNYFGENFDLNQVKELLSLIQTDKNGIDGYKNWQVFRGYLTQFMMTEYNQIANIKISEEFLDKIKILIIKKVLPLDFIIDFFEKLRYLGRDIYMNELEVEKVFSLFLFEEEFDILFSGGEDEV